MPGHKCELWTALGIHCPEGLVRSFIDQAVDLDEGWEPEDLGVPVHRHRKSTKSQPAEAQQATLAILLELYRRSAIPQMLEGAIPEPARIPYKIAEEAYASGARGRELAVWTAAAAASLIIGLKFGPGAVQLIPKVVIEALGGGYGAGRPAGQGFQFQAPVFHKASRTLRRLMQSSAGGGGLMNGLAQGFGFGAGELP